MRVKYMAAALERSVLECEQTSAKAVESGKRKAAEAASARAEAYRQEIVRLLERKRDYTLDRRISAAARDSLAGRYQQPEGEVLRLGLQLSLSTTVQTSATKIAQDISEKTGLKVRAYITAAHPSPGRLTIDEDYLLIADDGRPYGYASFIAPAGFNQAERYIYTLARAGGESTDEAAKAAREAAGRKQSPARQKTALPTTEASC